MPGTPSTAVLLDDGAVYKRTSLGQRELLRGCDDSSSPAIRILARVNGYTQLRQLVELAPDDARELIRVVPDLVERGLLELVESPRALPEQRKPPGASRAVTGR
jgi:hypothetical protein